MTNAESQKRWREKQKEQHRCVQCATQDERTLAGYSLCSQCVETQKLYKRKKKSIRAITSYAPKVSIYEIVRLATAEGLSYGNYVAKHRYDNTL